MKITIGADGGKNCHITLSGTMELALSTPVPIVLFRELAGAPKKLRIDAIQFAIQEKMGFNLWWLMTDGSSEIILPLESRGGFDFEKIKPLSSPEFSIGIGYSTFKVNEPSMNYLIMLDLTKQ